MKYQAWVHKALACALLAISLGLGQMTAPAHAAGLTIYVDDDTTNNGQTKCPATPNLTIEDGIAALGSATTNVTFYICPGFYTPGSGYVFAGFSGLKIIGLGNPHIQVQTGFGGWLFDITSSTGVLVQGLYLDGNSWLAPTGIVPHEAIRMEFSSGKVMGNTIAHWHVPYNTNPTPPPTLPGVAARGIVVYSPTTVEKVAIQKNTIFDAQESGIWVTTAGSVKIISNRITFNSAIIPADPIAGQSGIALVQSGGGSTITGNQIETDSFLNINNVYNAGIMIYETSSVKVSANQIHGSSPASPSRAFAKTPVSRMPAATRSPATACPSWAGSPSI